MKELFGINTRIATLIAATVFLGTGQKVVAAESASPTGIKNVVLVRIVGSMSDFKQIIGRGTRVRDDYGKLFFNIVDYNDPNTYPNPLQVGYTRLAGSVFLRRASR